MLKSTARLIALLLLAATCGFAQDGVTIRVNAAETVGPYKPSPAFSATTSPISPIRITAAKLIGELASVGNSPVYIRTHFMLATGDGTPSLKWGSTNAYTETPPASRSTIGPSRTGSWIPICRLAQSPSSRSDSCRRLSPRIRALHSRVEAGRQWRRVRYRLGVSAEGLCEVGRAGESVGEARGGEVRPLRSGDLVLGSVE